ncbi:MAG: hypothetical protein UZ16_OP3001000858 [Candidatus Hinthialibacteria bacterium OLB16]|nr:MAG: hypothetical protein UZ16_OP3001000858 [Candidatus Hinthialibacteria bacterium OLB16]
MQAGDWRTQAAPVGNSEPPHEMNGPHDGHRESSRILQSGRTEPSFAEFLTLRGMNPKHGFQAGSAPGAGCKIRRQLKG